MIYSVLAVTAGGAWHSERIEAPLIRPAGLLWAPQQQNLGHLLMLLPVRLCPFTGGDVLLMQCGSGAAVQGGFHTPGLSDSDDFASGLLYVARVTSSS